MTSCAQERMALLFCIDSNSHPAPHLVTNECETMKNATILNCLLKSFFSFICCVCLMLATENAHGKQAPSKSAHTQSASIKKTKPPAHGKKTDTHRQKSTHSASTQSKSKTNKASASRQNKHASTKVSNRHHAQKNKSGQTVSIKKQKSTIPASQPKELPPSSFHFSLLDFSEEQLQEEMKEYIGIPYRSGGISPRGMDCSGFAKTIYANLFGIQLPHSSAAQFSSQRLQNIDEDELQTGDLVFFSRKKRINHVGVYLGDGNFIHATNGQGITVSSLDDQHWKSRVVGTKRPMSFDRTGMDGLQLEGGFDIRLNTGSHIKSYARDEFRPSYDSAHARRPYVFRDTDPEVYNFDHGHRYAYAIEYHQYLLNNAFNVSLSAAREKLDKATAWNIYDRDMDAAWPFYNMDGDDATATVRHGFKLAGAINPLEGLIITPSLMYFTYDQPSQSREILEVPKRIFGLNTQIIPMAGPWSVSMAMHYADQQDMMDSLFKTSTLLNTMDMSLKLGYSFSRNLELSIMGKHDFTPSLSRTDNSAPPDSSSTSDFLFKLDMKY